MRLLTKYLTITVFAVACFPFIQSCSVKARIEKADKKFDIGEYYAAGAIYRSAYSSLAYTQRSLRAYTAFQQGECYRITNSPTKAANAYYASIRNRYKDSIVYLNYARMLYQIANYTEASKMYEIYLTAHPNNRLAQAGLDACTQVAGWKKVKTEYVVKRADGFNPKSGSAFSPAYAETDGSSLWFTSSRVGPTKKISPITGFPKNDLYQVQKNVAGVWEKPKLVEGALFSDFDEGTPSFTQDGKTVYFTLCPVGDYRNFGGEIYCSTRSGGEWGAPTRIVLFSDSTITTAHPAINPAGDTLYFVSDRKEGGYGGKDIWFVAKTSGGWGLPQNLGPTINTAGDEMFPYVAADGSLYFSSNGLPGFGGLDIFHATRTGAAWKVENMMQPVNSAGDDFGITFEWGKQKGYFSSNRGESRGYDRIWSFEIPEKLYVLNGVVTDIDKQILGDALVRIVGTDGSSAKIRTKKDGTFRYNLKPDVDYVLQATCRGYLNQQNKLSTQGVTDSKTYKLSFQLAAIGKPVPINNIFYDFGKWTLTKESEQALNGLVKLLQDNPNITIELGAHTDMIGSVEANQILSERRAQSVVNYLITAGIAADRLTSKGYGKGEPVVVDSKMAAAYNFLKEGDVLDETFIKKLLPDQQNSANQLNRRTEFRVVKTTYGLR